MEDEVKTVSVTLDKNSIAILKQIDNIHKSSLINLAISLISKTGYYQTLIGNPGDSLESITELTSLDNIGTSKTLTPKAAVTEPTVAKKKGSWDDF